MDVHRVRVRCRLNRHQRTLQSILQACSYQGATTTRLLGKAAARAAPVQHHTQGTCRGSAAHHARQCNARAPFEAHARREAHGGRPCTRPPHATMRARANMLRPPRRRPADIPTSHLLQHSGQPEISVGGRSGCVRPIIRPWANRGPGSMFLKQNKYVPQAPPALSWSCVVAAARCACPHLAWNIVRSSAALASGKCNLNARRIPVRNASPHNAHRAPTPPTGRTPSKILGGMRR